MRRSWPGGKPLWQLVKLSWNRSRPSSKQPVQRLRRAAKTLLNNNDPDFVNPKEKLYDKFPLTVHQMDIIIGVLFALIVLFLVLGFTHTSFFGLFGG